MADDGLINFTIEKGVPIPPRRKSRTRSAAGFTATARKLAIGDSFYTTDDGYDGASHRGRLRRLAPMMFCHRREGDGWRIWRVA